MPKVQQLQRPDADLDQALDGIREMLALVGGAPDLKRERALILTAIMIDALSNDRTVSANRVRHDLTDGDGYVVRPQLIGGTYAALARTQVLVPIGTERNEAAPNRGHSIRIWRLAQGWCA